MNGTDHGLGRSFDAILEERPSRDCDGGFVCGLDEAGRGPLAGPVCAAAVILGPDFPVELLNDSKKLTEKKRDIAMRAIYERALAWGIGWASSVEIDQLNILRASLLAMERSYVELVARALKAAGASAPIRAERAIVDGLFVPTIDIPCLALVKADATEPSVMAASILAKTARDRMMERWDWIYPEYGYERHKGYPTKLHLERIALHGPSPIQRLSFRARPVEQTQFDF